MSGGTVCKCVPQNRNNWRVLVYRANYSAFNGNRHTPSAYSAITCESCHSTWRTKAVYVDSLTFAEGCR